MSTENILSKVDLPVEFLPSLEGDFFAAIAFISPRSQRWKLVWNLCQKTHYLEKDKTYLACFDSSPASLKLLGEILTECHTWKTSYLFVNGSIADKKLYSEWLSCYVGSFKCPTPSTSYCLNERDYSHFRNQLSNTASDKELVSFVTPCKYVAAYMTFSDTLPVSFEQQFTLSATARGAVYCPNYRYNNFKGPFTRKNPISDGFAVRIGVAVDEIEKPKKARRPLWKKIVFALIALAILGTFLDGSEPDKEPNQPTIQQSK